MPSFKFASNSVNPSPLSRTLCRHPTLFGVPFLLLIVGASFGLQAFTQTRYDLHAQRVTSVSKQEELGLNKRKKKLDIREEYFRLSASEDNNWDHKRIPRPKDVPEWGVPPDQSPPPKDTKS